MGTAVAWILMWLGAAQAQPEPWLHQDGTIHYYHAMSRPGGITWGDAADSAGDRGGYLATVTSQAENDFIFGLVDSNSFWYERPGSGRLAGPWLGGTQDFGAQEPDSGWHWVTAETMSFRNWSPGEPDNQGGENALHFGESIGVRVPTWDDASSLEGSIRGFVRELSADSTTVGLVHFDSGASDGYTLFAPMMCQQTYLVDNKGRLVHRWRSQSRLATTATLLEDGRLLRVVNLYNTRFPVGGRVELVDWDGTVTWSYTYCDSNYGQHHGALKLPNGNVMMLAYERKVRDEAVAAGRDPSLITEGEIHPEHLIEVDPETDSIVWEWHLWDHVVQDFDSTKLNYGVVANHPELVDLNYLGNTAPLGIADWIHANSIDYNPALDQVMISTRSFSEIWVIDHSTTTEQARGHSGGRQGMGGDVLYRWGNPQSYRAGSSTDQQFFGQHDARWIEPGSAGVGHIMVFNNGFNRPDRARISSVDEIAPACDSTGGYRRPEPGTPYGPAAACWSYGAVIPGEFWTPVFCSAQRLHNGNTLICQGVSGAMIEVTTDSQVVWRYVSPMSESTSMYQGELRPPSALFHARHYAPEYPGLAGRDLTPGYPMERYRTPGAGIAEAPWPSPPNTARLTASPNPFRTRTAILLAADIARRARVTIVDASGRVVRVLAHEQGDGRSVQWDGKDDSDSPVGPGVYYCSYRAGCRTALVKIVKLN